jgi:hypothetical protein
MNFRNERSEDRISGTGISFAYPEESESLKFNAIAYYTSV